MSQKSKFWQWIDHRVKLTLNDKRMLVGTFIAFDKHLNVVLADTDEYRVLLPKKQGDPEREIKRPLGLLVIRGDSIVSISAERSPNVRVGERVQDAVFGPGKSLSDTRGAGSAARTSRTLQQGGGMPPGLGSSAPKASE